MNRPDCKHPSAFCLMTFRTKDRVIEETVWNSRDMVVPDKIPHGKYQLDHVDSHRDEFKPFLVPRVGSRIFISPVLDKVEAAAEATFAERQHDEEFKKEFGDNPRETIAKLVELGLKNLEEGVKPVPVLATVTVEMAAKIRERLEKRGIR